MNIIYICTVNRANVCKLDEVVMRETWQEVMNPVLSFYL